MNSPSNDNQPGSKHNPKTGLPPQPPTNKQQIPLNLQQAIHKLQAERSNVPNIDSNFIFQSNNLPTSNLDLASAMSFNQTPSSQFNLRAFTNDSSFMRDNGSIEQFKQKQEVKEISQFPPEINIDEYFYDFYRREIEASHSATKEECISIVEPYSIETYAATHFRKQLNVVIFNKQGIKKLTTFSDKPFSRPLLSEVPVKKKAVVNRIATYILIFIGVYHDENQDRYYKNKKDEQMRSLVLAIVYMLHNDESLINECFMQLMKTMRDIPTQESLDQCWKLFLTLVSLINVVDWDVQNVIRWFLVNRMFNDDRMSQLARYAFIRFHDRLVFGRSFDRKTTRAQILEIPSLVDSGNKAFRCSLYVQMWNQRRKYPKLPIPLTLYLMIKALIKNGALVTPKPFPYLRTITLFTKFKNANTKSNIESSTNESDETKPEESQESDETKTEESQENSAIKPVEKQENDASKPKESQKSDVTKPEESQISTTSNENDDDDDEYDDDFDEDDTDGMAQDIIDLKNGERVKIDSVIRESQQMFDAADTGDDDSDEDEDDEDESLEMDESYETSESSDEPKIPLKKCDMKLLKTWSEAICENENVLDDGEVNNLMGLFLSWLLNLVDPIVPKSMSNYFIETFSNEHPKANDYSDFVENLPLLHKNTLKYIIGFLREISKNEEVTRENNKTIAKSLATYFVSTTFATVDPFTRKKMIAIAPTFLLFCLESIDVSDVYPLNPAYLVKNEA